MGAQSTLNALVGTVMGGAAIAARGIQKGNKEVKASGKDAKMAAKARKQAQEKVNAILENKELSKKARTRRVGQVLDEFKGGK